MIIVAKATLGRAMSMTCRKKQVQKPERKKIKRKGIIKVKGSNKEN